MIEELGKKSGNVDNNANLNNISNVNSNINSNDTPKIVLVPFDENQIIKEKSENIHSFNEEDDNDSIDLSRIKEKVINLFKGGKKGEKETHKKEIHREEISKSDKKDELSFDYKKTIAFAKKNSKIIIPILFILIAIFISSYFRMMPSDLPITDNWAEDSVIRFYKQQIESQINQQYPNLPQQNREVLLNQELEKVLEENKEQMQKDIKQISQQFKASFQDENGDTYLLAIDPYLWYSQARNVINHGSLGDKIIDGEAHFSLRDGRLDKKSSVQLHPYIAAYLYKFLKIFNPNISLMRALFLLPVIIIGLSLIPAFFIGRKFSGNVGGFFAAIFLAVNGPLLSRTPAGFADTDAYNILWPLLITWFFLESYDTKNIKTRLLYGGSSGLTVGLYAATWGGWSSTFLIIFGAIFLTTIYYLIQDFLKYKRIRMIAIKEQLSVFVIFVASSCIFVTLFDSFNSFSRVFTKILKFVSIKSVGVKTIWPNVLTTVAEFNTQGFSNIVGQMGGDLLFFLSLLGILFLLIYKWDKKNMLLIGFGITYYLIIIFIKDSINNPITFLILLFLPVLIGIIKALYYKENINLIYSLILSIWLLSTAYAFTKGIRFALLIAPPFAIGIGSSFGYLYKELSKWINKGINLNIKLSQVIIFVILALFVITPFVKAEGIAKNEVPSMNDAWYNSLTKIKDNTQDAIITSWWDFGHWFVAIAERRVTFDGGDQGERIHWVGRTLRTDSEQEAIGILRMLNCVQETAPQKLDEFTKNSLKSINILYEIFPISDRNQAIKKYQELGLTKEGANIMIEYTHCKNLIPNFYITSQDMVGKAGVWGHFGSWDFKKASMFQNTKKLSRMQGVDHLVKNFDLDETSAEDIYTDIQTKDPDRWISPWPGYLTSPKGCDRVNDKIICNANLQGNQFSIEITSNTAKIMGTEVVPNSLVFATPEGITEQKFEGDKVGFSVILIPNGDNYRFVLADPLQAAGMFTRMFFLEGHGLKCFKKFDDVTDPTNQRIITWEVDFECIQDNKIYFNNNNSP